jgi:hypothetical protein
LTSQSDREAEAVAVLDDWPWSAGGCLIGGYAVAAYGEPRFSQDLDLVLPRAARGVVVPWVEARNFRLRRPKSLDTGFRDAARYIRGDFSIDLMYGHVKDRESGASIPEGWISSRSRQLKLRLLNRSTGNDVMVARPEAIWVLKIVAGRDQDIADLFAISGEPIDESEVREALQSVLSPRVAGKLAQVTIKASSRKIYSDALSSRALGRQDDPDNLRAWSKFQQVVHAVLPASPAGPA